MGKDLAVQAYRWPWQECTEFKLEDNQVASNDVVSVLQYSISYVTVI